MSRSGRRRRHRGGRARGDVGGSDGGWVRWIVVPVLHRRLGHRGRAAVLGRIRGTPDHRSARHRRLGQRHRGLRGRRGPWRHSLPTDRRRHWRPDGGLGASGRGPPRRDRSGTHHRPAPCQRRVDTRRLGSGRRDVVGRGRRGGHHEDVAAATAGRPHAAADNLGLVEPILRVALIAADDQRSTPGQGGRHRRRRVSAADSSTCPAYHTRRQLPGEAGRSPARYPRVCDFFTP